MQSPSGSGDPEKFAQLRTRFIKHKGHYHIPRWHHTPHPSVVKECARNALPKPLGHIFHPTHATLTIEDGATQNWFSRWHRKGLYKRPSTRLRSFWLRLANMRRLEYWNVSWWVAVVRILHFAYSSDTDLRYAFDALQWFTLGSIVWVINGFAAFLPFSDSSFMKAPNSQGWTAFLGATLFELGSIFGILEAWNREDATRFGWNVKELLTSNSRNTSNGNSETAAGNEPRTPSPDITKRDDGPPKHRWIWFSASGKYFRELGFLGAFFQLLAASIFWISGYALFAGPFSYGIS